MESFIERTIINGDGNHNEKLRLAIEFYRNDLGSSLKELESFVRLLISDDTYDGEHLEEEDDPITIEKTRTKKSNGNKKMSKKKKKEEEEDNDDESAELVSEVHSMTFSESVVDILPPTKSGLAKNYDRVHIGLDLALTFKLTHILLEYLQTRSSKMFSKLCVKGVCEILNDEGILNLYQESPAFTQNQILAASILHRRVSVLDSFVSTWMKSKTVDDHKNAARILHTCSSKSVMLHLRSLMLYPDHPYLTKHADEPNEFDHFTLSGVCNRSNLPAVTKLLCWPLLWKFHCTTIIDMMQKDFASIKRSNVLKRSIIWEFWLPAIDFLFVRTSSRQHSSVSASNQNSNIPWAAILDLYFRNMPYSPCTQAKAEYNHQIMIRNSIETEEYAYVGRFELAILSNSMEDSNSKDKETKFEVFDRRFERYPLKPIEKNISEGGCLKLEQRMRILESLFYAGFVIPNIGYTYVNHVCGMTKLWDLALSGLRYSLKHGSYGSMPSKEFNSLMQIANKCFEHLSPSVFYESILNTNKGDMVVSSVQHTYLSLSSFLRGNLDMFSGEQIQIVMTSFKGLFTRHVPTLELFGISSLNNDTTSAMLKFSRARFVDYPLEGDKLMDGAFMKSMGFPVSILASLIQSKFFKLLEHWISTSRTVYSDAFKIIQGRFVDCSMEINRGAKNASSRALSVQAIQKRRSISFQSLERTGWFIVNELILPFDKELRSTQNAQVWEFLGIKEVHYMKSFTEVFTNELLLMNFSYSPEFPPAVFLRNSLWRTNCVELPLRNYTLELGPELSYGTRIDLNDLHSWLKEKKNRIAFFGSCGESKLWRHSSNIESSWRFFSAVFNIARQVTERNPLPLPPSTPGYQKLCQAYKIGMKIIPCLKEWLNETLDDISQCYISFEAQTMLREYKTKAYLSNPDMLEHVDHWHPISPWIITKAHEEIFKKIIDMRCEPCMFDFEIELLRQPKVLPLKDKILNLAPKLESLIQVIRNLPRPYFPERIMDVLLQLCQYYCSGQYDNNQGTKTTSSMMTTTTTTTSSSVPTASVPMERLLSYLPSLSIAREEFATLVLQNENLYRALDTNSRNKFMIAANINSPIVRRYLEEQCNQKAQETRIQKISELLSSTLRNGSCSELVKSLTFIISRTRNEKEEVKRTIFSSHLFGKEIATQIAIVLMPKSAEALLLGKTDENTLSLIRRTLSVSDSEILSCAQEMSKLLKSLLDDNISSSVPEFEEFNRIILTRALYWHPTPIQGSDAYETQKIYFRIAFEAQFEIFSRNIPRQKTGFELTDFELGFSQVFANLPSITQECWVKQVDSIFWTGSKQCAFEERSVELVHSVLKSKGLLSAASLGVNETPITTPKGVKNRIILLMKLAQSTWNRLPLVIETIRDFFAVIQQEWSIPTHLSRAEFWLKMQALQSTSTRADEERHERFDAFSELITGALDLSTCLADVRQFLNELHTPDGSLQPYSPPKIISSALISMQAASRAMSSRAGYNKKPPPKKKEKIKKQKKKAPVNVKGYCVAGKNHMNRVRIVQRAFAFSKAFPIYSQYIDWCTRTFGTHYPGTNGNLLCVANMKSFIQLNLGFLGTAGPYRRVLNFGKAQNLELRRRIRSNLVLDFLSISKSAIHLQIVESYLIRYAPSKLRDYLDVTKLQSSYLGKFSDVAPQVDPESNQFIGEGPDLAWRIYSAYGLSHVPSSILYPLALQLFMDVLTTEIPQAERAESLMRLSFLPCVDFNDFAYFYAKNSSLISDTSAVDGVGESSSEKIEIKHEQDNKEKEEEEDDDDDEIKESNKVQKRVQGETSKTPKTVRELIDAQHLAPLPQTLNDVLLRGLMEGDNPLASLSFLLTPDMLISSSGLEIMKIVQKAVSLMQPGQITRLIRALFGTGHRDRRTLKVTVHRMLCNLLFDISKNSSDAANDAKDLLVTEFELGIKHSKKGGSRTHVDVMKNLIDIALNAISKENIREEYPSWAFKILDRMASCSKDSRADSAIIAAALLKSIPMTQSQFTAEDSHENRFRYRVKLEEISLKSFLDSNSLASGALNSQLIDFQTQVSIPHIHHQRFKFILIKLYDSLCELEVYRKRIFEEEVSQEGLNSVWETYQTVVDVRCLTLGSLVQWCGAKQLLSEVSPFKNSPKEWDIFQPVNDDPILLRLTNVVCSREEKDLDARKDMRARLRFQMINFKIPQDFSRLCSDRFLKCSLTIPEELKNKAKDIPTLVESVTGELLSSIDSITFSNAEQITSLISRLDSLVINLSDLIPCTWTPKGKENDEGRLFYDLKNHAFLIPFNDKLKILKQRKQILDKAKFL